jgi:uncharacterized protein YprB with RNaseH-like and TPR domain
MLESCFIHLPGVGAVFTAKLCDAGIHTWEDALNNPLPCAPGKADALRAGLEESRRRLAARDVRWFSAALPPAEQWRLLPHFRGGAAYVDIETTGLSRFGDSITTIALYDGNTVRSYIQGENLEAFADDILAYSLLVTWNGRCFDAPILRRFLRIPLDQGHMGHLDLLPVFRKLGLRGGLKKIEKALGLSRGNLDAVDGLAAVRLWREYERLGDRRVLETLLAYNVEDVLSLEALAEYALARHDGLAGTSLLAPVRHELNPYTPDARVLRRLDLLTQGPAMRSIRIAENTPKETRQ